jgi:hypothetical protein
MRHLTRDEQGVMQRALRASCRVVHKAEPVRDRQWIFDCVVHHYRAQPRRCPLAGPCLYRLGEDRCFIGALIGPAHYDPDMEGYPVRALLKVFSMPAWFRDNIDLIEGLQNVHDTATNWWPGRMDMVLDLFAEERGLMMPKISTSRRALHG